MSVFEESVYGELPDKEEEEEEDTFTTSLGLTISMSSARTNMNRDVNIFDAAWLNHGLAEARRMKRFRRIEQEVSEFLVDHFRDQLDSQTKQQALFSLLGPGYVLKNFPHHKFQPELLDGLDAKSKARAVDEMKLFINDKVRLGLDKYHTKHEEDKKLMADIREIFFSDLNKEIHNQLLKDKKIKVKQDKKGRTIKVVELENTIPDRAKFIEVTLKDMLYNCPEINELVLSQLSQRVLILPPVFRQQLFSKLYMPDLLTQEDVARQKKAYSDQVKRKLRENKLSNVSDWTGRKTVDASVILAFERSSALKQEFEEPEEDDNGDGDSDDRLVFLTRILTVAKLCNANFSPTHIFWLVRASKYFPDVNGRGDDNVDENEDRAVHFAYHFERFSQVASFTYKQIFTLAQETYDALEQEETQLLIQLHESLQIGVSSVDPTLFSQSIIDEDEDKGTEVLRRFLKNKKVAKQDLDLFGDFRLFLRKWFSEAFVGSMSRNGASLVWDFLFIYKFSKGMMVNVCLTLVHLLKPLLQSADSFRKVQTVMLEGPKVLLIRDLRRVLQHFSRGGEYADIPAAPNVPRLEITPPSAGAERRSRDKRIETLNNNLQ